MARSIPAAPYVPPDPAKFGPRSPIKEGAGTVPALDVGHVYDLARAVNLCTATVNAGPMFQQAFPDQTFWVASPGWVYRCRFRLPELGGQWNAVRVSVYGRAPAPPGTGAVQVLTVNAGFVATPIPVAAALQWYDTVAPYAPCVFAAGEEELWIQTDGQVEIDQIQVQYMDYDPTGLYPGADGALPAGAIPGASPVAYPADDAEVAADKPLCSDVGLNWLNCLRDVEPRPRVYANLTGFCPGLVAGNDDVIPAATHRQFVPVLAERRQSTELNVSIYAENVGASALDVQYGFYGDGEGQLSGGSLSIPNGLVAWHNYTIEMPAFRLAGAPRNYPGFLSFSLRPTLAIVNQNVRSIVVWGR